MLAQVIERKIRLATIFQQADFVGIVAALETSDGLGKRDFAALEGQVKRYEAKDGRWTRSFCTRCGTPLTYRAGGKVVFPDGKPLGEVGMGKLLQ